MKTNADASCSTTFSGMNLRKRKKLLQHCENIVNGQGKGKGHIIWKSTEKMDQKKERGVNALVVSLRSRNNQHRGESARVAEKNRGSSKQKEINHGSDDDNSSSERSEETDEDGSDNDNSSSEELCKNESDEEEYNEEDFVAKCRTGRYAESTRSQFLDRYNTMIRWITSNAKDLLPLTVPFSKSLCHRYVHFKMSHKKKGVLAGTGNLYGIIQMLKYEGFTKHGYSVPEELLSFFKDAHETLKRKIQTRIDDGKQSLADSHAQNASWQSIEFCSKMLHDWRKGAPMMPGRSDSRCHMYFLGSVQSISRGERFGKIPLKAFRLGKSEDHIAAGKGLSSKTDPKGKYSYDKRFWPNYKNVKMCFVTAVGRHLLSVKRREQSDFLFMTKKEAQIYETKLEEIRLKKTHKKSTIGPHKKFDRIISTLFKKLPQSKRIELGISESKNFVPHCKRKAAFEQAIEADGVDAAMVHTRADHHASNYSVYGARPIVGVQDSGGPPAGKDITMAKILAGLPQYKQEFNEDPPHWDSHINKSMPWSDIIPCYDRLPQGMKALVPLAVAQVIYHYHRSSQGLNRMDRLFTSPLWTTHQSLRDTLYTALRGGDTGQPSALQNIYRDRPTDQYLWTKENNETSKKLLNEIRDIKNILLKTDKRVTFLEQRLPLQSNTVYMPNGPKNCHDPDINENLVVCENDAASATSKDNCDKKGDMNKQFDALKLPPPPKPLTIEDALRVERAWQGWHGTIDPYPWKTITPKSQHLSQTQTVRRKTLQILSKIRCLMDFVQGGVSDADVEKNVSHAWSVCKQSAKDYLAAKGIKEWPLHGSIRTAYGNFRRLKKQQPTDCEFEHVVENFETAEVTQPTILTFFTKSGQLCDMQGVEVINEEENDDSSTFQTNPETLCANKVAPPEDCYICPLCPDDLENRRNLVVYRTSKTLWQHWDAHHHTVPKPALWKFHLVAGMKLEKKRTAPWLRVENAMSFHSEDYAIKQMREDILQGNRVLEKGTYVELQPSLAERSLGARWFAVIRDSRVFNGELFVEYCDTNCQTIYQNATERVCVQSILRVGSGPHVPFSDVPLSAPVSTPEKRNQESTYSPMKRHSFLSARTSSPKAQLLPQSNQENEVNARSKPELQPAFTPQKRSRDDAQARIAASSTPEKRNQESTYSPMKRHSTPSARTSSPKNQLLPQSNQESTHNDLCNELRKIIFSNLSDTLHHKRALRQFNHAATTMIRQGWSRCTTIERDNINYNMQHDEYKIVFIQRDGNCLFHCLSQFVNKRNPDCARSTHQTIRNTLAQFVATQKPPTSEQNGKYGGLCLGDVWLPCEESLLSSYGGEIAIFAFVKKFNIPLEVHSPENGNVLRYQIDGRDNDTDGADWARDNGADILLHTIGWQNWSRDTGERLYSGDHWQIIVPKSHAADKKLSSQASSRVTPVTNPRKHWLTDGQNLPARNLDFSDGNAFEPLNTAANLESSAYNQPTKPKNAGETKFTERIEVQLMLRAVKTHHYMCNAKTNPKNLGDNLDLMTIDSDDFFVYDFENHFDRVYPSHVRKILHAFPDLNEDNRSFYLALGIGIGMDPFTLQCLFRNEGERIMRGCETNTENIRSLLQPGLHVNFEILRWCWPPEFDQFSVMIIDKTHIGPFKFKVFETNSANEQKKMVVLLHDKNQKLYQLLRRHTGNDSVLRQRATKTQVQNNGMRCPSISTLSQFKLFQNEYVFLAGALQGIEPPPNELDAIWRQCVEENGLKFDPVTEGWTEFPGWAAHLARSAKGKDNEKDGSMVQSSWKVLRTKLLRAFDQSSDASYTAHEDSVAQNPCIFVDAGSESGRGLYHMIGDKRITHVAGIEFQLAWFQLSQKIFNNVRNEFEARGYRMPEVTLIHSCMLDQKPVLNWLYSITSIMWMNNFVFDKYVYFDSRDKDSAKYRGKSLLGSNKYLSPNAAYNFSLKFEDITLIAVHLPEAFLDVWNYSKCDAFQVSCTWSQISTKEEVTILRHTQHLQISHYYTLASPTFAASSTWDIWTKQWSDIASAGSQSAGPSFEYSQDTIFWRQFSTLTHRNWLVCDIIRAYITILRRQFPNTSFDEYRDPTSKSQKQLNNQFRQDSNVFAFNLYDSHWIGAKLEKSKKRILVYDSYPADHAPQFKQIEILAAKLGVQGPFDRCEVKVPHQRNANDCGITTCLFMLCMAQNIEDELIYDSPTVCRLFRLTLFADILNQKVTVLKKKND